MQSEEFKTVRRVLGKTQNQLAQILCSSVKTIQSFEQGWRNISAHTEREMLLLLSLKTHQGGTTRVCWNIINCPSEQKDNCIVWELKAGHLCWFVSGTCCQGRVERSWDKKIEICRSCEVYQAMFE